MWGQFSGSWKWSISYKAKMHAFTEDAREHENMYVFETERQYVCI